MERRQPIKLIITIVPDNTNEEFNRVSMVMECEHQVFYNTIINSLVGILDNLITEQKKNYEKQQKEMVQLEQSKTETGNITKLSIYNESGSTTYDPTDNGPAL